MFYLPNGFCFPLHWHQLVTCQSQSNQINKSSRAIIHISLLG